MDYEKYGETIYHFALKDRMDVYYIHKAGYAKTYATLSAPLGSIHRHYKDGEGRLKQVSGGAAHFLEHKVFEKDGKDISEVFSLDEAQLNAFTEHTRTTYLFHATDKVYDHLERLFSMYFHPDFTEEGVEKERNIIAEELNMHLDDPHYLQYHRLMQNLYHKHPLKDDILGTKESISSLGMEELKAMHTAYYQPESSIAVIVGDLDAGTLERTLTSCVDLPERTALRPAYPSYDEPPEVKKEKEETTLDVLTPSVLIGIKLPPLPDSPSRRVRNHLKLSMLLDMFYGKSSDLYETMLEKNLINDSYGLELAYERHYAHVLIGSESPSPEQFETYMRDALHALNDFVIDKTDFRRIKRQMIGNFIRGLDSLEALAQQFTEHAAEGMVFHDILDIAQSITLEEIERLQRSLEMTNISSHIARSKH